MEEIEVAKEVGRALLRYNSGGVGQPTPTPVAANMDVYLQIFGKAAREDGEVIRFERIVEIWAQDEEFRRLLEPGARTSAELPNLALMWNSWAYLIESSDSLSG